MGEEASLLAQDRLRRRDILELPPPLQPGRHHTLVRRGGKTASSMVMPWSKRTRPTHVTRLSLPSLSPFSCPTASPLCSLQPTSSLLTLGHKDVRKGLCAVNCKACLLTRLRPCLPAMLADKVLSKKDGQTEEGQGPAASWAALYERPDWWMRTRECVTSVYRDPGVLRGEVIKAGKAARCR